MALLHQLLNWENSVFAELVGKTIKSFVYDKNDTRFHFELDNGDLLKFQLEADCCSETWLYSVDNEECLKNEVVENIVEVDTNHINLEDGLGRQDVDQVYGIGIKTAKGICSIIYRNSSNGYYGGWIQKI